LQTSPFNILFVSIKYESIVPWGRSYQEYIEMFSLTKPDLDKSILGCADGPASFNYAMHKNGKNVISIDPIYQFSAKQIKERIATTYNDVINQTRQNQEKFIWTKIKKIEELGEIRMSAMKLFLSDFEKGKMEHRYIYAELPSLPFKNKQFDLTLSSHFLFMYTQNLSFEFHVRSIEEMLRVSNEVRIFPIVDLNGITSGYLNKVMEKLSIQGYQLDILKVDYEFQKGGNEMLIIK
jgi:hypothetical protein